MKFNTHRSVFTSGDAEAMELSQHIRPASNPPDSPSSPLSNASDVDALLGSHNTRTMSKAQRYQTSWRRLASWHSLPRFILRPRQLLMGRNFTLPKPRFSRLGTYLLVAIGIFISVSILNGILRPSFSDPPQRYKDLERRVRSTKTPGRGNVNNEKVYIATNIINEKLIRGIWGRSLLTLIDLLGENNVFVSVYENDSGPDTSDALRELQSKFTCNSSVVTGGHLPLSSFPTVRLPTGEDRVQRITYLAEVRNRLLQPLEPSFAGNSSSGFRSAADTKFDKILFINDVFFNPLDAAQLLFSTDAHHGTARYRAACAIDFVRGIMFYDSFVVRDADGFGMGLMFYPWFTASGRGSSRTMVQSQVDAVPVRSCWGGMAAFNAQLFQTDRPTLSLPQTELGPVSASNPRLPLQFRSSQEPFWEAAECCLLFADIEAVYGYADMRNGTGVLINPYIRVAYSQTTWDWLPFFRRFERMFEYLQYIVSIIGYPEHNPRRLHEAGELVEESVWVPAPERDAASPGQFRRIRRQAAPGGFCGQRRMFVMKRDLEAANTDGAGKNWEKVMVPYGADR